MINSVYNTVKLIVNKDKYGEVTPANFDLAAKEAQLTILVDILDQIRRSKSKKDNRLKVNELQQVLDLFYSFSVLERAEISGEIQNYFSIPTDVIADDSYQFNDTTPITVLDKGRFDMYKRNRLTSPSLDEPIAYKAGNKLYVLPLEIGLAGNIKTDSVSIGYIRQPEDPSLSFVSDTTILDSDEPYDFELPLHYHDKLTSEICKKFGVHLREEQVYMYGKQELNEEQVNENS